MNDHLYRSRDDRILFGVAGGVAEQLHVDPSLIRILWAILVIPTGGLALLLYVLMAFVVPEEPAGGRRGFGSNATSPGFAGPAATTPGGLGAASASAGPASAGSAGGTSTAFAGPTSAAFAGPSDPSATPPPATGAAGPGPGSVPSGAPPPDPWWSSRNGRAEARDQRRAARDERRAWRREHRDPLAPLIIGLVLILLGGYFLVRSYLPSVDAGAIWPLLIVAIGVVLLVGSIRRPSDPNGTGGGPDDRPGGGPTTGPTA